MIVPAKVSLQIWVWHEWLSRPEIGALQDHGHVLSVIGSEGGICAISPGALPQMEPPDLILHPAAHWWDDAMFEKPAYLKAALNAAKKRRNL